MRLLELIRELQIVEGILKDQRTFIWQTRVLPVLLEKRKRIVLGSPNKKVSSRLDTRREKGRVSASFVEKKDDWKNEYLEFLKKKQGMHHSLLVESCLVVDPKIGIFFIISDQKNS